MRSRSYPPARAGATYDIEFGSEINADGTRAFFITREPILGQDDPACGGCVDVYERTLGPTPQTFLLTQGPTGGFGPYDAFGPDIEIGVGTSRDGRRYYFYTHEQLTSVDTDSGAADLYVSAVAEPGGYPRPRGATPIHLALVPAYATLHIAEPHARARRSHSGPAARRSRHRRTSPWAAVAAPRPPSPPAICESTRLSERRDRPTGPTPMVTVSLTNVMHVVRPERLHGRAARDSDRSDDEPRRSRRARARNDQRTSRSRSRCRAPPPPTRRSAATAPCRPRSTRWFRASRPKAMRSIQELGQVQLRDGDGALFAVQGLFVP